MRDHNTPKTAQRKVTRRVCLTAMGGALGGVALAMARDAGPREEGLMRTPGGGNAQQGSPYPSIEAFPTLVDTRHANQEAVDLFQRFFATKSRHDCEATMAFISRDLSVYVDATLGWELHGYDALQDVWAHYMPTWGEGRSYPTRMLGEVHGGTGSVMVEFTDTPELFGADMRVLGAVDVVDGKITRWADYWDSAAYDGKRFETDETAASGPASCPQKHAGRYQCADTRRELHVCGEALRWRHGRRGHTV